MPADKSRRESPGAARIPEAQNAERAQRTQRRQQSAQARIGRVHKSLLANPHDRAVPPSPLDISLQRVIVYAFVGMLLVVFGFILMNRWRRGVFILGFAMTYLAVVRWLVDSDILGVLAVRSRKFDSAFNASLGVAMMLIAFGVESLGS
ncbi:putative membrane protein [Corynebacterium resistens DSM 45100]|uniref:Membrane protein n=1 Tax=Corynebacterium resistens (strain DSM 45100 / JCM 12819 / GTC 2026 / SICGH 158) TaxID=662755 RepID=F8E1I8_CORRG|nr:DUF3017 domain-containing protein [Corynebacterium resistens]AEI10140.1 putative membrane protein [Corynebacterium resistens DSM 45100]